MKIEYVEVNWTEPEAKRLHEIPDNEQAKRAIEVALSGTHELVFLHTINSPASDLLKATARIAKENRIPFKGKVIPVCNCGAYGNPQHECTCSIAELKKYMNKVIPVIKSANMIIEVIEPFSYNIDRNEPESNIVERILQARRVLKNDMPSDILSNDCEYMLETAVEQIGIDAIKVISLALTIAKMDFSKVILVHHIAEAVQYLHNRSINQY